MLFGAWGLFSTWGICSEYQCCCLIVLCGVYILACSWLWGHHPVHALAGLHDTGREDFYQSIKKTPTIYEDWQSVYLGFFWGVGSGLGRGVCFVFFFFKKQKVNFVLENRIKEGRSSHSGPGANPPTVQSRSPDFCLFSCHSEYWLLQKKN